MATSCFPIANGVPGNYNPPDWLNPSATPFDGSPDDPRWVGSLEHSFGDGTFPPHVVFRGLTDSGSTKLLLSWLVNVDPQVTQGQDALYVGFGSTTNAILVNIALGAIASSVDGTAYSASARIYSGGSWGPALTGNQVPAWVSQGTRAWIDYYRPNSTGPTPESPNVTPWAVQMVVPIGTSLDPNNLIKLQTATTFKIWYDVILSGPGETQPSPSQLILYTWPGTPDIVATLPTPGQWADARFSNNPNDPDCTQEGISINAWDNINQVYKMGSRDPDPALPHPPKRTGGNNILFDNSNAVPGDATPNAHQNRIFAIPDFPSSITDPARKHKVRARFRMANWGAQIGSLTSNSWKDIPGGGAVEFDTTTNECSFLWPVQSELNNTSSLSSQMLSLFRNNTTTSDQCIVVELTSTWTDPGTGAGEVFKKSSDRLNFQTVRASSYSGSAEINLSGLQRIGLAPRDVYIYVEKKNMPAEMDPGYTERYSEILRSSRTPRDQIEIGPAKRGNILNWIPQYVVHCYYDTGQRTTLLGGGSRVILKPMSSFGYIPIHDGSLVGWVANLHGAIRIAENFYLLRVPEGGAVKINTVIQARENFSEPPDPSDPIVPIPPKPIGCLGLLFMLILRVWKVIKALFGLP